jgi:hypothetical protein
MMVNFLKKGYSIGARNPGRGIYKKINYIRYLQNYGANFFE